jgi:hypothetical protein
LEGRNKKIQFLKKFHFHRDAPKSDIKWGDYSNCIVTGVWSDGYNWTPSILFTHNPIFDRRRNPTFAHLLNMEYLDDLLKEYNISPYRIQYIESSRKFTSESPEIVEKFFSIYNNIGHTIILTDCGNAFKRGTTDILTEIGFEQHITYPAPVHQYMSPNDNSLHGAAKATWRKSITDGKDDIGNSLFLLCLLDFYITLHSEKWFRRNFFLGQPKVAKADVNLHINGFKSDRASKVQDLEVCQMEYISFINSRRERVRRENQMKELND